MTSKSDWLLQLVGDDPIDPIRIQKGMFLFAKTSNASRTQTYDFVPYNWGPCSFEIYDDLDHLLARGQIEEIRVPGASWHKYRRTAKGHSAAASVARSRNPTTRRLSKAVARIRSEIQTKSFEQLLRSVYADYPDYAAKSLFRS